MPTRRDDRRRRSHRVRPGGRRRGRHRQRAIRRDAAHHSNAHRRTVLRHLEPVRIQTRDASHQRARTRRGIRHRRAAARCGLPDRRNGSARRALLSGRDPVPGHHAHRQGQRLRGQTHLRAPPRQLPFADGRDRHQGRVQLHARPRAERATRVVASVQPPVRFTDLPERRTPGRSHARELSARARRVHRRDVPGRVLVRGTKRHHRAERPAYRRSSDGTRVHAPGDGDGPRRRIRHGGGRRIARRASTPESEPARVLHR